MMKYVIIGSSGMFEWVQYQFPTRLFLERESTHRIGTMVKDVGRRVLLLSLKNELANPDEMAIVKTSIEKHTNGCIVFDDIFARPGFNELDTVAHFVKQSRADCILAFGMRDTFHTARALALLSQNDIFAADLPSVTFPLKRPPLPIITVPVAPSSGDECSPSFAIYDPPTRTSFWGTDTRLFPAMVFVDPNVTTALTDSEMLRSGVAVLAASVESMLSRRANEFTNSIALRALELISKNLPLLMTEPGNVIARMNVSTASVLTGMAHGSSQLGISSGLALALNYVTGMDYNVGLALMLPHVMEYNLTTSAGKYVQIARALEEDTKDITVIEAAIKAVEGVRKVYMDLKLPMRLSDFDISKSVLGEIAYVAMSQPLMKNTVRELDRNEVETILIAAY
jgi:alcohol dehydrogenase